VRRDQTSGVKLYRLAPGQYDILVEFTGSAQIDKPSKILKGVEIGPSGKVEQRVSFSTGQIKLLAYNKDGKPTLTEYLFTESGKDKIIAKVNTEQNSETFYLTPGKYDITAENVNDLSLKMKINLADVEVKEGQLLEKLIRFQTGQLFVKAINANKEPIPITYRVTPVGRRHEILSKGEFSKEGGVVDLAPGNYDVYVEETIPDAVINPQSKTSDVTLTSGEVTEITANVISGTLKIKGIDSTKHEVYTDYVIRDAKTREDVAFTHSEKDLASISLPPGEYAIISTHSHSSYTPKPVMELPLVRILGGETTTETVTFKLGGLKLVGRNTKEFIISTKFIIYRSGSEEEITTAIGKDDWVYFDLPEGLYDVKAVDNTTAGNNPPTIWMRDVNIENGKVTVKEAVYTNGKIKLIARGQNNTVIECDFKIYEYGTDGAIFSGKTSDQWLTFDIEPGRYYLEGAFKDVENHQTLKKWISLIVNENQIVETIIRF
ncbi:hypothetical protein KKA47_02780, partial [bacterium]|nr:hypothetical protein [bacterium]